MRRYTVRSSNPVGSGCIDAVRGDRLLPARSDIDAIRIPHVLSVVFICDYERDTARLRYRLVGEDVGEMYRVPLRGRYQDEFTAPDEREGHLARIREFMEFPAVNYSVGEVYAFNQRQGAGERLLLPLASDGQTADAVIGATAYDWKATRPPGGVEHRAVRWTLWSLDGSRCIAGH